MKQLSLIEKAFFLKKTKIFEELDLDLLLAIADKLSQDIYDKEEKVFMLDQVANRMYLIAEGEVEIYDNQKQKVTTLSSGDFFGDESLFNYRERGYSAICSKDSLLLTLSRTHLLTIISECPTVAISLLTSYSQNTHCRHIKQDKKVEK